jgi:hypothetical protein
MLPHWKKCEKRNEKLLKKPPEGGRREEKRFDDTSFGVLPIVGGYSALKCRSASSALKSSGKEEKPSFCTFK